jgi:hypothetical protein
MTKKKEKSGHESKANEKTWGKGVSGNPGGRSPRVGPNGETLAAMIRGRTLEIVNRAFDVALSPATETKDVLIACFGLLDRGWGKPKETMDIDAKVEGSGIPVIQIVRVAASDGEN